jgi:spore germination cell wall hydrolase CwlJ-like protein
MNLLPGIATEWEIIMKMKILALLLNVALISAAGAAQARNDSNFRASAETVAEVQNNGTMPPTAAYLEVRPKVTAWARALKTMFHPNTMSESCLARAVYFEARSESIIGQLAVATVILNRVKASNNFASVCGVVYKGANRLNACQFSFACDGKPDVPDDMDAWNTALNITTLALTTDEDVLDQQMQIVAAATHYHADYVDPSWSKSLHRLTKIGRHIFYSQG